MKVTRKLIRIDEELCDGCGRCVPGCAEGALQIVDGKARLVAEKYCDGLGACLGECPTGALTVVEAQAEDFDPAAVKERLNEMGLPQPEHMPSPESLRLHPAPQAGCPGAALRAMSPCRAANEPRSQVREGSALTHWPVQIRLVPPQAPFLKNAHLLVTADCAAAAYAGLHRDFLPGRVILLGCPKFDDATAYVERFKDIFGQNEVASVTVLEMEVPCCSGLSRIVAQGLSQAGARIPLTRVVIGRDGSVLGQETVQ